MGKKSRALHCVFRVKLFPVVRIFV